MNILKKVIGYLTPFQWFEVLGVIGFTIYFAAIDTQSEWWYNLISSIAAITGIFCVVLCAAGRKAQYYWGFANIIGYIIVSWVSRLYGEVMLNALYYLPSQFVGLYLWKKHAAQEEGYVQCRKLSAGWTAVLLAASALGIWGYKFILQALGGNVAWLDSTSTVISVVANALMVLRFREQWLLWIIVDAVTVVMWFLTGDYIMTAMWAFYLLNAIYGFWNWTIQSRKD